ncbi:SDR family oxidoreductase [Georgenia thermotolerans]|nr:NAD(P)H-binding protein [Georgenia thermotolerans]
MGFVLVTGATGTLGQQVVARLLASGRQVRALTHRSAVVLPDGVERMPGDLTSGEGLAAALAGVDTVVHAASNPADPWATDVEGTEKLLAAIAAQATPARILHVSIVGVDRSELSHYRAKYAAEQRVAASGTAWDILRATQFHTLAVTVLRSVTDANGVITVPADVFLQPVDVADVADRLVALLARPAKRRVMLFGGPEVLSVERLARDYVAAGGARSVQTGPVEHRLLTAWRSGHQLVPDHTDGSVTWRRYLDLRCPRGATGAQPLP